MIFLHFIFNLSAFNFSSRDQGMLLINVTSSDRALTIFDDNKFGINMFPLGFGKLSIENLKYQLFHSYYEAHTRNFWLEPNYDRNIRLVAEKTSMHGSKTKNSLKTDLMLQHIKNTDFYKILHDNSCLTLLESKSRYYDANILKFIDCDDKNRGQMFSFVSKMKAECILKLRTDGCDSAMIKKEDTKAQRRVDEFAIN